MEVLISPPADWPGCFQSKAMRAFVGRRGLRAKRCRLVDAKMPAALAGVSLDPADSKTNAMRAHEHLGWDVVEGFAVLGVAGQPDRYVAHKRWWCATPADAWVDVTPAKPASGADSIVLAESDLPAPPGVGPAAPASAAAPNASAAAAAALEPYDERGKVLAYRMLVKDLLEARLKAQHRVQSGEIGPAQSVESAEFIVRAIVESFAAFAGLADAHRVESNPLLRIWEAVVRVVPRVLCMSWRAPSLLGAMELDELAHLAASASGGRLTDHSARAGHLAEGVAHTSLLSRATDEGDAT